jgi:pyocin large subunit-like protein
LNELGFIWSAHNIAWDEYLQELQKFKERYGHCNVPKNYTENTKLSVWVKSQRRAVRTDIVRLKITSRL